MKTSKKDFLLFQKECLKWINIFGLKSYEVWFKWEMLNENRAELSDISTVDRIATIKLAKDFGANNTFDKNEIRRVAFHEVMELFLTPYYCAAQQRWGLIQADIDEINHNIIRTLENVVFK